ncbi:hypothetical protein O3P69_006755 [Scylla paramamosain]|uniref:Uncharacterized protein n=1 Tax=Scylla paramamosain TaxID=85552 RepID=A0AAW0U0W0_SCYPA
MRSSKTPYAPGSDSCPVQPCPASVEGTRPSRSATRGTAAVEVRPRLVTKAVTVGQDKGCEWQEVLRYSGRQKEKITSLPAEGPAKRTMTPRESRSSFPFD